MDYPTIDEMADDVHGLFFREGWKFGEYDYPSELDIQDLLAQCRLHLDAQQPGTIIEVANVAVRKESDEVYEVYVKLGGFRD